MTPIPLPDSTQKYDTLLLWPTKVCNNRSDPLQRLPGQRGRLDSSAPISTGKSRSQTELFHSLGDASQFLKDSF